MQWGAQYGIGVLIDFHATNGSQNGYDHSAPFVGSPGRGQQLWDLQASRQPNPSYPAQAVTVIAALAARYGSSPALLGFGLLNEPTVRAPAPDCVAVTSVIAFLFGNELIAWRL